MDTEQTQPPHHVHLTLIILVLGLLLVITTLTSIYLLISKDTPKPSTTATPTVTTSPSPPQITETPEEPSATYTLLMEEGYNGTTYQSFQIGDSFSAPGNAAPFVITDANDTTGIYSTYPKEQFSIDKMFAFAEGKLFVVNTQKMALDIYAQAENDVWEYETAVKLPNYNIGKLYGISCADSVSCYANTAFHLESGCEVPFNPATQTFDEPICYEPDGSQFAPGE